MEGWRRYWGKAGPEGDCHLLAYHSLDVAAVGGELLRLRPNWLVEFARVAGLATHGLTETISFLLALHDLGKFGAGFQGLRPDVVRVLGRSPRNLANSPKHDALGRMLWLKLTSPPSSSPCPEALLEVREAEERPLSPRAQRSHLKPWISAVMGHHGRPPPPDATEGAALFDHFEMNKVSGPSSDAAGLVKELRTILKPAPLVFLPNTTEGDSGRLLRSSWWLAGFSTLCDWIGSNTKWFPFENDRLIALDEYLDIRRCLAELAVHEVGLAPRRVRSYQGFGAMFPTISTPTPLQRAVDGLPVEEGPQLLLIEDLTGSGKTEAALSWVARLFDAAAADGLYFALPTMATANAMHARVAAAMKSLFHDEPTPSLILAHSGPHLLPRTPPTEELANQADDGGYEQGEESATQGARSWFSDNRKRALLADAGVGTIDQALVGVLRAKHAPLRLLGLHRHVLVVDEVHACDDYMNNLLELLLEVQASLGGSAVLLSATLSLDARGKLLAAYRRGLGVPTGGEPPGPAYPSLIRTSAEGTDALALGVRDGGARKLPVAFLHSLEAAVGWCEEQAKAGKCVAWIRNTVRDANLAFDELVSRLGAHRVQLFHARFPLGDRLALEQDIVARFGKSGGEEGRQGRIVIATQVLEQSLDVDFDELLTDLAPIDRMIQRAGRLQRHSRANRTTATLHVLAPEDELDWMRADLEKMYRGTKKVYGRGSRLLRTQRVLREEGAMDLPKRARYLVESVFGPGEDLPPEFDECMEELSAEGDEKHKKAMARFNRINFDQGYTFEGAPWLQDELVPTRLGDPSSVLRLINLRDGQYMPWSSEEALPESIRWRLGEVSVRADQVSAEGPKGEELRQRLREQGMEPPPHVILVVMKEDSSGWEGSAVKIRGDKEVKVSVHFDRQRGLEFKEV